MLGLKIAMMKKTKSMITYKFIKKMQNLIDFEISQHLLNNIFIKLWPDLHNNLLQALVVLRFYWQRHKIGLISSQLFTKRFSRLTLHCNLNSKSWTKCNFKWKTKLIEKMLMREWTQKQTARTSSISRRSSIWG